MKNILVFIFASLLILSIGNNLNLNFVYASSDITFEKTNPNNSFGYNIKRLSEKLNLMRLNMFNKNSIGSFISELSERRERELVFLVEEKQIDYLETASSRYITSIGNLSEIFELEQVSKEEILKRIVSHPEQLASARDHYPANSAHWLMLQQAQESAKVLISKVQEGESE